MQLKGKYQISNIKYQIRIKSIGLSILGDQKREEEGRGIRKEEKRRGIEEKKKSKKGMEFHGLIGKC